VKTEALVFPFDLFGSAGAARGAELLADALREMIADNKRERKPTRARAYAGKFCVREVPFTSLDDYQDWRQRGRQAVRRVFDKGDFLLWITGNHLGTLPVYEELGSDALAIQFDAHLDIYNLTDCTSELSHGNFLLHSAEKVPGLINVGSRELLLTPGYISKYYQHIFPAANLAVDAEAPRRLLQQASLGSPRVVIDIDCDVFDPSVFPAVSQPAPFGLSQEQFLRLLDAAWSPRVVGVCLSEFDPARDRQDGCLALLTWLIEFLLLRLYE
jgi:arginase family enzyme